MCGQLIDHLRENSTITVITVRFYVWRPETPAEKSRV